MYRMSTHVQAFDAGATLVPWFRLRAGISTRNFDSANLFEFLGNDLSEGKMSPVGAGLDYEAIFAPPQATRLDGITYGVNNFSVFYNVLALGPDVGFDLQQNGGSLVFSDTQIDEIECPAIGSNGYLARWGNDADTNDDFDAVEPTHLADPNGENWRYWTIAAAGATFLPHKDLPGGSSLITDAVTSCSWGDQWSPTRTDSVELFSSPADIVDAKWNFGDPNTQGNQEQSAVDYDVMYGLSNEVYYRATFSVWSSNAVWDAGDPDYQPWYQNVVKNNPVTRMRCGWPFGVYSAENWVEGQGALGRAGPVSGEVTNYYTLIKGLPSGQYDADVELNNFFVNFESIDWGDPIGGTLILDEVAVELFPTEWF
jgi:hypothetical protein